MAELSSGRRPQKTVASAPASRQGHVPRCMPTGRGTFELSKARGIDLHKAGCRAAFLQIALSGRRLPAQLLASRPAGRRQGPLPWRSALHWIRPMTDSLSQPQSVYSIRSETSAGSQTDIKHKPPRVADRQSDTSPRLRQAGTSTSGPGTGLDVVRLRRLAPHSGFELA